MMPGGDAHLLSPSVVPAEHERIGRLSSGRSSISPLLRKSQPVLSEDVSARRGKGAPVPSTPSEFGHALRTSLRQQGLTPKEVVQRASRTFTQAAFAKWMAGAARPATYARVVALCDALGLAPFS